MFLTAEHVGVDGSRGTKVLWLPVQNAGPCKGAQTSRFPAAEPIKPALTDGEGEGLRESLELQPS